MHRQTLRRPITDPSFTCNGTLGHALNNIAYDSCISIVSSADMPTYGVVVASKLHGSEKTSNLYRPRTFVRSRCLETLGVQEMSTAPRRFNLNALSRTALIERASEMSESSKS